MQNKKKNFQMPDTYVIIFMVVVFVSALTYFIPTGKFEVLYSVTDANNNVIATIEDGQTKNFDFDGQTFTVDATGEKTIISEGSNELAQINKSKAKSYEHLENGNVEFKVTQQYGDYVSSGETKGVPLFADGGEVGFFNFAFEGLVSGDKWGTAVGIIAFILISGGAFGVILKTGAIEIGILSMMKKSKNAQKLIIPIIFFLFAIGGVVFGLSEEVIPLSMIIIPIMVAMGYDSIVGLMITLVAAQIGFATSWMNPFSVAVAQSIAGVPIMSGSGFRIIMFLVFTVFGIAYTMVYAKKIQQNPELSLAYETDDYHRENFNSSEIEQNKFTMGHFLVVLTLFLGIVWIIWGVNKYGYYIPEIAGIFFTMGIASGVIGVIFKLNNMTINDIAISFRKGSEELVGAAMIVGLAQGIILVLGGQSPYEYTVMNTVLHSMSNALQGLPSAVAGLFMYIFQSIFNFFVVSGSGQAAVTMPLMAPLAELIGITKQVAVLAFQLGDGLTNIIVPTSGCLMAILGVAKLDWKVWAKFQVKFLGSLCVLASIFVVVATMIGYN